MDYTSKDLSEFEVIKHELVSIKQQDERLMESFLQISRLIQRAALPAPRLLPDQAFICRHGHINCLGLYGNKEDSMNWRLATPTNNLSKSLKNLEEIISSLEDMSIRESSDVSCLGHDSD